MADVKTEVSRQLRNYASYIRRACKGSDASDVMLNRITMLDLADTLQGIAQIEEEIASGLRY